jgi:hypothetical protein
MGLFQPGMVLTLALAASSLEAILSPIAAIDLCFGPMKMMPASSTRRENSAFSERKP